MKLKIGSGKGAGRLRGWGLCGLMLLGAANALSAAADAEVLSMRICQARDLRQRGAVGTACARNLARFQRSRPAAQVLANAASRLDLAARDFLAWAETAPDQDVETAYAPVREAARAFTAAMAGARPATADSDDD